MTEFWTIQGGGRFQGSSLEIEKRWFYGPKSDRAVVGRCWVTLLGRLDHEGLCSQLGNGLNWHGAGGVVHIRRTESKTYLQSWARTVLRFLGHRWPGGGARLVSTPKEGLLSSNIEV